MRSARPAGTEAHITEGVHIGATDNEHAPHRPHGHRLNAVADDDDADGEVFDLGGHGSNKLALALDDGVFADARCSRQHGQDAFRLKALEEAGLH